MNPTVSEETWGDRICAARRRRDKHLNTWAQYARLHTNAYVAIRGENDDQLVNLPNGDQVKLALVFRNLEQTLALLEVPEIGVRVTATDYGRELTEEDTHKESIVEAALVRSMKRSGLVKRTEEVDYVKRDGMIVGHGVSYSWWRRVVRKIEGDVAAVMQLGADGSFEPVLDESGAPLFDRALEEKAVWNDVQDEHISPLDFLFDAASKDMRKSPWHGSETIMKAAQLAEDGKLQAPDDIKPTAFKLRDLYGETPEVEESMEDDSYRVIRIWDKVNYELLTFIEGTSVAPAATAKKSKRGKGSSSALSIRCIDVKRWPVTFQHPDDSPFSFFIPIPANDHPFGVSQIEHIRNASNEADKTRTRQANLVRQSKRIPWYRKGAVDPEQLRIALNGVDAEPVGLDLQDGMVPGDVFGELPIPDVNPDLFNAEQAAEETVRKTSGISEIPFGGAGTATESENMTAVGSARPNRKRRLLLDYYSEVARKHLDFRREFDQDGQTIRVYSADGEPLDLVYGRAAFSGEMEVVVQAGGEATTVSPVRAKTVLETGNLFLGRFSPQFDRIFARQVLTALDFRDINKMLQAMPRDAADYMALPGAGGAGAQRPRFNPNDQTTGQAIRAAINAPSEGAMLR